MNWTELG